MTTSDLNVRLTIGGVDESAYLRADAGVSIVHGRSDAESAVGPGRATFTLDNSTGRFTLGTGGNRLSGQSVLVEAWDGSAWHTRFVGAIDSWPLSWDASGTAVVQTGASDALKRLALDCANWSIGGPENEHARLGQLGASGTVGSVGAAMEAIAWLGAGYRSLALLAARTQVVSGGQIRYAPDAAFVALFFPNPLSVPTISTTAGILADTTVLSAACDTTGQMVSWSGASGSKVVAAWAKWDAFPGSPGYMLPTGQIATGSPYWMVAGGVATPKLDAWAGSAVPLTVGKWHHFAMSARASGVIDFWIDGALAATSSATGSSLSADPLMVGSSGTSAVAAVDYIAGLSHSGADSVSAEVVAGLYGALAGFAERTDERIARALERAGVDLSGVTLDTGRGVMTRTSAALTCAQAISGAVATEGTGAAWYAAVDGTLRFRNATHRWGADVALSVSVEQVGAGLRMDSDGDAAILNLVTATNPAGVTATEGDATSQAIYGTRAESLTVDESSAATLAAVVGERLASRRRERLRVAEVELDLLTQPAIRADALALEVGSVLRITDLPAGAPDSELQCFVEGWTETIGIDSWSMKLNTSPGVMGEPAIFGTSKFDSGRFGI